MDLDIDRRNSGFTKIGVAAIALAAVMFASSLQAFAEGPSEQEQYGETVFAAKCAGCHSIGGGKLVGPDLDGVVGKRSADWVAGYVKAPDKVRASGDPTAAELTKQYGGTMPNLGLSSSDVEAVVSYLTKAATHEQREEPQSKETGVSVPSGNASVGRDLFTGQRSLANGGPACISCHNVAGVGELGGGSLARDLTNEYSKLGDAGITSVLKTTPFPGMREAFASRPLTNEEVADLNAFFAQVDGKQSPAGLGWEFPVAGLAVSAILLGITRLVWRKRLTGVRRGITGELSK